jgi:pyrimidine-nucleoside phosphorylase
MLPQWTIERKRDGLALADEEIGAFIRGFTDGSIPDYQMAAFAMAVFFRGMTPEETASLTLHMMRSGETLDTASIATPKVDKHSTGGIGDKISIVLAPLVACCGVAVPMISGRGLGLTGGTLDKLESIPGYRTRLEPREFLDIVRGCGCSIIGQTDRLAPADRKLYALRDVTGTVPSIPLITASILSKKLAAGLDGLVLDVKCGHGAFMRTRPEARVLAESLCRVAAAAGKRVAAWITAMDEPLGRAAGNALEIRECVATLHGHGPADVVELALALGGAMLRLAGLEREPEAAARRLRAALERGEALDRFRRMVELHGGDPRVADEPDRLPAAPLARELCAPADGYVQSVDARLIGEAALLLGAGRTKTTDAVDPAAGVDGLVKSGEAVRRGQPLLRLHAARGDRLEAAADRAAQAVAIGPARPTPAPLLLESIGLEASAP